MANMESVIWTTYMSPYDAFPSGSCLNGIVIPAVCSRLLEVFTFIINRFVPRSSLLLGEVMEESNI
jgi:hypothetical protein